MGSSYAVFDLRACPHMHAWTHTRTWSKREGEPTLAVIAEMINKRLRCNPEGFSASHKTEDEEKKAEERVRRRPHSSSRGKKGMSSGRRIR